MNKLLKLREWLTLSETAEYLTLVLSETVLEKDLYRLALDGHLRLSFDFVNKAKAIKGKIVGEDEIEFYEIDNSKTGDSRKDAFRSMVHGRLDGAIKSLSIDGDRFINLEEKVQTIDGIWDLMMIGNEQLDIEHAYQNLTDGPEVTLININGAFVEKDGIACEIQESYDLSRDQMNSIVRKKDLEIHIAKNNIADDEKEKLWEKFEEDQKKHLDDRASRPFEKVYYPAAKLPDDGVLVVRMTAIMDFLSSLGEGIEKPLSTKERNTMLVIIAALCKGASIDYTKKGIASAIELLTESIGAPITDDTIRNVLKQISEAVDSRSK